MRTDAPSVSTTMGEGRECIDGVLRSRWSGNATRGAKSPDVKVAAEL